MATHTATRDELVQGKCKPCEGGVEKYSREQAAQQVDKLPGWSLSDDATLITRKIKCADFKTAVELLNRIAEIAEQEQHHPDLHVTGYRNLRIDLTTHAIGGLSENDFIIAAKSDALDV